MLLAVLGLSVACTTGHGAVAPEELENSSDQGIYERAGRLMDSSSEPHGSYRLRDLEDVTWRLTRFAQDEEVPDGMQITVAFDAARISGVAGCNRYFAGVTESDDGGLTVGLVGSTKMACPPPVMQVEDRYLRTLQQVHRFSVVSGQLALTYRDSGATDTLLFTPSE